MHQIPYLCVLHCQYPRPCCRCTSQQPWTNIWPKALSRGKYFHSVKHPDCSSGQFGGWWGETAWDAAWKRAVQLKKTNNHFSFRSLDPLPQAFQLKEPEEPGQDRGQDWEHWLAGGLGDSSSTTFLPSGSQAADSKYRQIHFHFCPRVPPSPCLSCSPGALLQCWCQQWALRGNDGSTVRAHWWWSRSTAHAPFESKTP